jgi:diguanylate cyclase (GGDEF)-like protein/PAS domain S-box-containing protein
MNDIPHNPARAHMALVLLGAMALVSLLVLWGWVTESFFLTTFYLGTASMKANSAIGFLLLMAGVVGVWRHNTRLSIGCGLAAMLLGSFSVLAHVFQWPSGFDVLLFNDPWAPVDPGRMAVGSAVSFVLGGAMLAVHNVYPHQHINRYDMLLTAFLAIPLFVFFCYVFAPQEVLKTPTLGTMPLHSCLNFLFFFFAISLLTTSKGAAGLLNRNTRNARNFRWLFFLVLILPLCLGSVLNHGVQQHWISVGIGIAIFCLFSTLIVASTLAHHTILLDHWFRQLLKERRRSNLLKNQIHELLEISADGILLFDGNFNILHANSGAARILGYTPPELNEMVLAQLMPERLREPANAAMRDYLQRQNDNPSVNLPDPLPLLHRDGHEIPVAVTLSKKIHEDHTLVVALIKSVARLDDKIRNLQKKASTDPLTQTFNRSEFEDFCRRINLHELRKSDLTFCVLLLDIDNFKKINDQHGHAAGDRALTEFSQVVQHTLREGDRLFRTGGEEFIVVATNADEEGALAFAERIRLAVKNHTIIIGDLHLSLTCSIGVCVTDAATPDLQHAVKSADQAMYQAKRKGKDCCVLAQ